MPDTYKLILTLEKNGVPLQGFDPLVRRLTVDQSQSFDDLLPSGGGAVSLPVSLIGTISLLIFTGDQPQTYTPGVLTLNAGGLVLMFNVTGPRPDITNASGNTALNKGFAGGT